MPADWEEGHLIKIRKKENLRKRENYGVIMLLSVSGQVFNNFAEPNERHKHLTAWIGEPRGIIFDTSVLEKNVIVIQNSYNGLQCKVVHGEQLIDEFQMKTGVRQGCLIPPFLFYIVIDWIIKTSTSQDKQ